VLSVRGLLTEPDESADDSGSVSVEAALGVIAILFAVLVAAWCAGLLVAQLAVSEAARAAVRAAARGDDGSAVVAQAQLLVPAAHVDIQHVGSQIHVQVTSIVHPPGALRGLGELALTASSVAADESVT
jgi:Flp pilus assembly protein TadG